MVSRIKPAEPIDGRIAAAIAGPQASGKTTSALRLATGIVQQTGGKICLIDTENKRALRYAKNFKFNHLPLDPPFSPSRYDEAFAEAEREGYGTGDVIIIDSMSHEHEGPGGVLEMHEQWLDDKAGSDWSKREKIKFLAWNFAKKDRKRFITFRLQRALPHVILCFRAKEKLGFVKDSTGKEKPVNNGWQPIGGEEYFFEMDITMILPEGAQGKPDWSEKAARINEFGDGPLKKLLKSTDQISEETGAAIKRLCSVSQQAPQQIHDQTDPAMEIAQKIRAAIKAAPTEQDLFDVWNMDYKPDLDAMMAQHPHRYEALKGIHDKRLAELIGG